MGVACYMRWTLLIVLCWIRVCRRACVWNSEEHEPFGLAGLAGHTVLDSVPANYDLVGARPPIVLSLHTWVATSGLVAETHWWGSWFLGKQFCEHHFFQMSDAHSDHFSLFRFERLISRSDFRNSLSCSWSISSLDAMTPISHLAYGGHVPTHPSPTTERWNTTSWKVQKCRTMQHYKFGKLLVIFW